MPGQKNLVRAATGVVAVYSLYTLPFKAALTSIVAALVAYAFVRSEEVALVILTIGLFMRGFNRLFESPAPLAAGPAPVEGFQARDPESMAKQIEAVRVKAPQVAAVTGVLESPDILDNVTLQPMQQLMSDAQPGASIPASAKARVLIYPPAESFVDANGQSKDKPPKEQPYLQNGPDDDSIAAALISRGTDMTAPEVAAADMAAEQMGANPAF